MSIDVAYVSSYVIHLIVELVIFLTCFKIYRNTKGSSLAYKNWALGTYLLLISTIVYISCGIFLGCSDRVSSTKNEIHKIIGYVFMSFGFFYIPVGVMELSKDVGMQRIDATTIKKLQKRFFITILCVVIIFTILIPGFEIMRPLGFTFNILFTFIWVITLYYFRSIYPLLKTLTNNNCWTFIYFGMFCSFFGSILGAVYFINQSAEYPFIFFQLLMSIGFVIGFLKLGKMLEAL